MIATVGGMVAIVGCGTGLLTSDSDKELDQLRSVLPRRNAPHLQLETPPFVNRISPQYQRHCNILFLFLPQKYLHLSDTMIATDGWDYIIAGCGLAGCVVASRLKQYQPSARILIVEAGPDVSRDKDILHYSQLNFIGGEYDWAYKSGPHKEYDGREIDIPSGHSLSLNLSALTPLTKTWMSG